MTPEEEEREIQERYLKDKDFIGHICVGGLPCFCIKNLAIEKKELP
jgi:hypothetical protein